MASRISISRDLHSVLPALSSALPETLIDLAISIYAQSRSKASALKPEEEVAREHVCCVLAAERYKQRLNLPAIEPRPPCPPRVFKRVYKYIDAAVLTTSEGQRFSSSRKSALTAKFNHGPASARNASISFTSPRESIIPADLETEDAVHIPDWVNHAIGYVAHNLGKPEATTMIKTAVRALLHACAEPLQDGSNKRIRLNGRSIPNKLSMSEMQLPSLIVAITVLVFQRLAGSIIDYNKNPVAKAAAEDMMALKRISITRVGACVNDAVELLEEKAETWKRSQWYLDIPTSGKPDILPIEPTINNVQDAGISHISHLPNLGQSTERDRLLQEQNFDAQVLQNTSGAVTDVADLEDVDTTLQSHAPSDYTDTSRRMLCPMMQEKVNWLSSEKKADFAEWRASIISRIEIMEACGPTAQCG